MSICIGVSRHSGPLLDERGVNCRAVFISKFDWAAHHLLGLNSALYARWCPQVVNTCNCENNYWNRSLNLLLDSSQSSLEQSLLWNFPSCQIHRFKLLKFTKRWNTCNQSVKGNIIPKLIRLKAPTLIVHLGDVQKALVSPDMRPSLQIFGVVENDV